MIVEYPLKRDLARTLSETESDSLDFIVLITGAMEAGHLEVLTECVRALRPGGLLFVQGTPESLPELGVYLDARLHFKYWIAVESEARARTGLPTVHAAVMLFSKGDGRFNVKRTRFAHQTCEFCGRSLRDWGGKTHLMHPDGCVVSDVWTELPPADNYHHLSQPALDTILGMMDFPDLQARGMVGPREGIADSRSGLALQIMPPMETGRETVNELDGALVNVVHCGDALEVLSRYPNNSIDLAFADPPYNLKKAYGTYEDGSDEAQYVEWCNAWLAEYARVLKPTGSLYVLNLPRWTMHHAAFLNERLHLQNWIVWDALSEPRGKLMPAHYGLLFYTKSPSGFTFNYNEVGRLDARTYCLRPSCIRKRKEAGADDKEGLTDIWWDIHRIKHKRDRDYHPCQLPDALLERIIRLSSNPGDIVLDALCGAGTTPVVAAKLGRRYVGIDLDEDYVAITREKLRHIEELGHVVRAGIRKERLEYTKKELQLELRDIAHRLGRLPSPEDVRRMSKYGPDAFLSTFPTWGKALKAAKLEVGSNVRTGVGP